MSQAQVLAAIDAWRADVANIGGVPPPPPPPGGVITTLGMVYQKPGLHPFAFGQMFRRGDVPHNAGVVADCASFQCVPWAFYDDGSWSFTRVSGYCNVTAPATIPIAISLGMPSGLPFVAKPQSALDIHVFVDGVEPPITRIKLLAAGPVSIHEEVTRQIDAQVRVIYTVVQFRNGEIVVEPPVIENAGFMAPVQPNRMLTLKFVVGGVTTFIAQDDPVTAIDERANVKHHTRPRMLTGMQWLQWIGGDSTVYPEPDHPYVCGCQLVPPVCPTANNGVAYRQTYDFNYIGEDGTAMGSTGYGPHIGIDSRSSLFTLTTGGRKHWNYLIAEALSAGSWSWYLRDEVTGDVPRFKTYPTHSRQINIPAGSGPMNGQHDIAHHPSLSYVAAGLTGWQSLIDDVLFLAASNHFQQWPVYRLNDKGVPRTDIGMNAVRGAAWMWRTLMHALAICPATHPLCPDLVYAVQESLKWYRGRYVDGTLDAGKWVNSLGAEGTYTSDGRSPYNNPVDIGASTAYWDAAWMHAMVTQVFGMGLYMHLPIGAPAQADLSAVFMQSAKFIVGLCGDGITGANYRRLGYYAYPLGPVGSSIPPNSGWYPNHKASYDHYVTILNLQALDPALGGSMKQHNLEADVRINDWTTGFLSYEWPALVFAKMHGAPGADAAWTRVTSSSSWQTQFKFCAVEPEWSGLMPPGIKHPGGL